MTATMDNYHIPVMAAQCIDGLNIIEGGIYVDATFGGGGHARLILEDKRVKTLFGIDQDDDAIKNKWNDPRLIIINHNYRYMKHFLKYHKAVPVDGILADLGISSFQINEGTKGFSYRFDERLDMRMDQGAEIDAVYVLNEYTAEDLTAIFKEYGELNNAFHLANSIVQYRKGKAIEKVQDLLDAIKPQTPKMGDYAFFSKVFQALRIEVNNEIENLELFLNQCLEVLKPKGRLVIMSYHSLEDRCVKNFLNTGNAEGKQIKDGFGNLIRPLEPVNKKPIIPGEEELKQNPRSRSAKLRIAERN
ncbi:MAG: 16S rRNA (cytosine(1402)-N(4))-methyltransferase RsmH [Bacteroidia bacterium]